MRWCLSPNVAIIEEACNDTSLCCYFDSTKVNIHWDSQDGLIAEQALRILQKYSAVSFGEQRVRAVLEFSVEVELPFSIATTFYL